MALLHCDGDRFNGPCRTLFAVGLMACPHCKSRDFHEFGTRPEDEDHPMSPKITKATGVSDANAEPAPEAYDGSAHVDGEDETAAPEVEAPTSRPPSVSTVLDAVDGDPGRAREALDAENARETPRKTLVAQLEKILDEDAATDPESDDPDDDESELVDPGADEDHRTTAG